MKSSSQWAECVEALFLPAEQVIEERRAQRRAQAKVMHPLIAILSLSFFGFLALGVASDTGSKAMFAGIGVVLAVWQGFELSRALQPLEPYHGQWRVYRDEPEAIAVIAREPTKFWLQGPTGEAAIEIDLSNAAAVDAVIAAARALGHGPRVLVGENTSAIWDLMAIEEALRSHSSPTALDRR